MNHTDALVQPISAAFAGKGECRVAVRHGCSVEATSQLLDDVETISWGAVVDNISTGGIGVTLCYPFRPGTLLAVDLHAANGMVRTVLVRVVHVNDRCDGAWHLGCEFVKPMTESTMEMLI
jgi:hypothetical protein